MFEYVTINIMTIGEKIRKKRKELGLSQEALAKKINVSFRSIYHWEHNETIPRSDSLERLAKVFGVPLEWFFTEEGTSDPGIPPDILEAAKDPRMQALIRAMWPVVKDMKK